MNTKENELEHEDVEYSPETIHYLEGRLNKVIGQLNGVKKQIGLNRHYIDILIQISAAQGAINSFTKEFLSTYIKTKVVEDIRADKEDTLDELLLTFQRLKR